MLPKQTQLQNRTLSIQIPVSIVFWLARPPNVRESETVSFRNDDADGVGTISGSTPISTAEPIRPTAAESRKPGLERSIKYHKKGLTRASVSESCSVDAHGRRRCMNC